MGREVRGARKIIREEEGKVIKIVDMRTCTSRSKYSGKVEGIKFITRRQLLIPLKVAGQSADSHPNIKYRAKKERNQTSPGKEAANDPCDFSPHFMLNILGCDIDVEG